MLRARKADRDLLRMKRGLKSGLVCFGAIAVFMWGVVVFCGGGMCEPGPGGGPLIQFASFSAVAASIWKIGKAAVFIAAAACTLLLLEERSTLEEQVRLLQKQCAFYQEGIGEIAKGNTQWRALPGGGIVYPEDHPGPLG